MDLKDKSVYSNYRWVIIGLLFAATTVNYFDRIVLSVAVQYIKDDLGMDNIQYGYVLTAFQVLYTVGFLLAGRVIDRLGTKLGYLLSIFLWSVVGCLTGMSGSAFSLAFWRGGLGLTESGNFPAAIKSVSQWFPAKERSFATSLFNSGPAVALVVGPPLIAMLTIAVGWRWTFGIMGSIGFLLVLVWPFLYRNPNSLAKDSQHQPKKIKWVKLLRSKESYGIMAGKFFTDPVWWFYVFWLPNYLYEKRGFDIKAVGIAMPLVYAMSIVFSIFAGWAAGFLISRGWAARKARKTVMLVCAMCLPFSALAVFVPNVWVAILLVGLACSAHQGYSANIFSLVTDCFESDAVGSVTGLAGFAGGVGGILLASLAPGFIITYFGYIPIFLLMGVLHPLAIICIYSLIRNDSIRK